MRVRILGVNIVYDIKPVSKMLKSDPFILPFVGSGQHNFEDEKGLSKKRQLFPGLCLADQKTDSKDLVSKLIFGYLFQKIKLKKFKQKNVFNPQDHQMARS